MSTSELVLVSRAGAVATLTLNRPERRNALNQTVIDQLSAALRELEDTDEIRAVVLTGGPEVFAAGADVAELATRSSADQLIADRRPRWSAVTGFSKPLIAAVNGLALGGGCELVLMCDLIVAGHTARFGQPEINLGILPGAGGTQRWPRVVGKYLAMELALTGRSMPAERAYQLGVINRLVPAEQAIGEAQELAAAIAAQPPIAVRLIKEAVNSAFETGLQQGLALERKNFQLCFGTADQTEGMAAFVQKRSPDFSGR